ncbi:hypothetical protein FQR65_LT11216 [Abscondita terminalis]|nr:hypothetical protein FQR65_LT11216 [Abscondita terminalis]
MCENILSDTLNNKIPLKVLLKWLGDANTKELNFKEITKWDCDRVAFISFFLNHIHEATQTCDEPTKEEEPPPPSRPVLFETNYVSPLYRPKKTSKSPKTPSNMCLGDFITRKDTRKRVQRNLNENAFGTGMRRINPTNVSQGQVTNTKNTFTFDDGKEEVLADYIERRSSLAKECVKIMAKCEDTLSTLPVFKNVKKVVTPRLDSVTFREQLNALAVIYSFLLDACLVVNPVSEMYFVITMLLSKCPNDVVEGSCILNSVHNQVYFAVFVLSKQQRFLEILDKFTVRLLLENGRFTQFADNKLLGEVQRAVENKTDICGIQCGQGSVYFACDTDNRNNFPSDSSFRNFRKQRDMFYEILQVWENRHGTQEWSFDKALGYKIRALINMHSEPSNFVHFAKLFKAQLITTLCTNQPESQSSIVRSLPNVDAEKLSRLNTRMVGKYNSSGINSPPSFNGHEEFFVDFITSANSYRFNRHLVDAFAAQIIDLNDFALNSEEFEIDSVKKPYLNQLKSLLVLAKFLGFVEAIPYKGESSNRLSQDVIKCQADIRNRVQSALNLKHIITQAVRNKTLSLTVPWLTTYLAMMDSILFKLDHIQEVLRLLFHIYYSSDHLVVRLPLGWLFDLPHFPDELYYQWIADGAFFEPLKLEIPHNLDDMNFFDHNVSYLCCPYLDEIKKILLTDTDMNRAATFKHITPVRTVESSSQITQKQLEDAFFRIQSDSVRKTVEFVSERVASGCVKEICYDMVPAYKQTSLAQLKVNEVSLIKDFAVVCLENLKNSIENAVQIKIEQRVTSAIDALLATAVLKETKELCVAIAKRTCTDRVLDWVHTHIQEDIFINHFTSELKKLDDEKKSKAVFNLPLYGKCSEHNATTLTGVEIMKELREMSCNIITQPHTVTSQLVRQVLESFERSLKERCDVNDCILLGINKMLLDLIILIVSHKPELLTETLCQTLCDSFQKSSAIEDLFKRMVSPRNQFVMSMSLNVENSYKAFVTFINSLIENELLSITSLQKQIENKSDSLSDMLRLRIVK